MKFVKAIINGTDAFQEAYTLASDEAQAKFDSKVALFWSEFNKADLLRLKHVKVLVGRSGLAELIFTASKVEQRPLGYFSEDDETFILLGWTTHKDKIYKPKTAIATCESLMKTCQTDGCTYEELEP